jgi:acyl-homoserine-lactone acylase
LGNVDIIDHWLVMNLAGNIAEFKQAFVDFDQALPYENWPQYSGTDYVQNSNDSYWLNNINAPITGVSPLYGAIDNQQSLRSRLAQKLLVDSAGSDGLFNPAEVEQALLSNRSYLAENILTTPSDLINNTTTLEQFLQA